MTTAAIYIERDGVELELEVEADYTPAERGNRRGHPDTWSPDWPEDCSVCAVRLPDGTKWGGELTEDETEAAIETLLGVIHYEQEE